MVPMARYERIAAELKARILAGQYAPGAQLPPQRELAEAWKTTLPTVRQALDQLKQDGFLRMEHGVGTFVADLAAAADPFAVASFTETLRERGLEAETRLLALDTVAQSGDATRALWVTDREGLVALTRVRIVGGRPLVHQRSYMAGRHRPALAQYDGTIPLYAFLRDRLGLLAVTYRETVTAAAVAPDVARVLDVAPGTPVMVSRRTTATADGQPLVYDEAHLPPSRVQMAITRQGHRCGIDLVPVEPPDEGGR